MNKIEVRDIEITLIKPIYDEVLGDCFRRFKLRDYRGPIHSIKIALTPSNVYGLIESVVIDVRNRGPICTKLEFGATYSLFTTTHCHRDTMVGDWLLEHIREATLHEIDENFLLDGNHFHNPHPENPTYGIREAAAV